MSTVALFVDPDGSQAWPDGGCTSENQRLEKKENHLNQTSIFEFNVNDFEFK